MGIARDTHHQTGDGVKQLPTVSDLPADDSITLTDSRTMPCLSYSSDSPSSVDMCSRDSPRLPVSIWVGTLNPGSVNCDASWASVACDEGSSCRRLRRNREMRIGVRLRRGQ